MRPWLAGPAFNNGWDLLIETPLTTDQVMEGVTHIWVSHEHPDHFVPKFFIDIAARYKSIPVLFQATRDRRVASFIESRGFKVTELPDRQVQTIDGVRVICGVSEFYDSWLHLSDGTDRSSISTTAPKATRPSCARSPASSAKRRAARRSSVTRRGRAGANAHFRKLAAAMQAGDDGARRFMR